MLTLFHASVLWITTASLIHSDSPSASHIQRNKRQGSYIPDVRLLPSQVYVEKGGHAFINCSIQNPKDSASPGSFNFLWMINGIQVSVNQNCTTYQHTSQSDTNAGIHRQATSSRESISLPKDCLNAGDLNTCVCVNNQSTSMQTLSLYNILSDWDVHCSVLSVTQNATIHVENEGSYIPDVRLLPSQVYVEKGGHAFINCSIQNPKDSASPRSFNFFWMINGIQVSVNQNCTTYQHTSQSDTNAGIHRRATSSRESINLPKDCLNAGDLNTCVCVNNQSTSMQTLSLYNILSDWDVQCSVLSVTENATIHVENEDELCLQETDNRRTEWGTTKADETTVAPCPNGYHGTASRHCRANGTWERPNYLHCIHRDIIELANKIKNMANDTVQNIGKVLHALANATNKPNAKLTAGDINLVIESLSNIVRILTTAASTVNAHVAEPFISTVDNVIHEGNKPEWEIIVINSQTKTIAIVLDLVTDMGFLATDTTDLNNSVQINRNSILLVYGKLKSQDFIFPNSKNDEEYPDCKEAVSLKVKKEAFEKFDTGDEPIAYTAVVYTTLAYLLPECKEDACLRDRISWKRDECEVKENKKSYTKCDCPQAGHFGASSTDFVKMVVEFLIKFVCLLPIIGVAIKIVLKTKGCRESSVPIRRYVIGFILCGSIIISNIELIAGVATRDSTDSCLAIAGTLHGFCLLECFYFMLLAIDDGFRTKYPNEQTEFNRVWWIILVIPWVLSGFLAGLAAGVFSTDDYLSEDLCWLSKEHNAFLFLVIPAAMLPVVQLSVLIYRCKNGNSPSCPSCDGDLSCFKDFLGQYEVVMEFLIGTFVFSSTILLAQDDDDVVEVFFGMFTFAKGIVLAITGIEEKKRK